jgi:excisionase family DNA binding protein
MSVKIFYSVNETCELLAVGRTTLYRLILEGRLDATKIGAKTLITWPSIEKFASELLAKRVSAEMTDGSGKAGAASLEARRRRRDAADIPSADPTAGT